MAPRSTALHDARQIMQVQRLGVVAIRLGSFSAAQLPYSESYGNGETQDGHTGGTAREVDLDTGPQGHYNTDSPIHLLSFTAPMAPPVAGLYSLANTTLSPLNTHLLIEQCLDHRYQTIAGAALTHRSKAYSRRFNYSINHSRARLFQLPRHQVHSLTSILVSSNYSSLSQTFDYPCPQIPLAFRRFHLTFSTLAPSPQLLACADSLKLLRPFECMQYAHHLRRRPNFSETCKCQCVP